MEDWRQYQEDAAAYFRSVGLEAETDVAILGTKTSHDIDVVVRFTRAGMQQLWLVECKRHRRKVTKDRALLLRTIVSDVGADRGIILAENGFQKGAHEAVQSTNVIVTTLADLRRAAADEIFVLEVCQLEVRLNAAREAVFSRVIPAKRPPGASQTTEVIRTKLATPWDGGLTGVMAHLGILDTGLKSARKGRFPALYGFAPDGNQTLGASTQEQFLNGANATLTSIERALGIDGG